MHFQKKCVIVLLASENRLWYAPVAQLDRVTGYEPVGRGFESLPAYQKRGMFFRMFLVFIILVCRDSNPERVFALRKQSGGLFLAKSVKPVTVAKP